MDDEGLDVDGLEETLDYLAPPTLEEAASQLGLKPGELLEAVAWGFLRAFKRLAALPQVEARRVDPGALIEELLAAGLECYAEFQRQPVFTKYIAKHLEAHDYVLQNLDLDLENPDSYVLTFTAVEGAPYLVDEFKIWVYGGGARLEAFTYLSGLDEEDLDRVLDYIVENQEKIGGLVAAGAVEYAVESGALVVRLEGEYYSSFSPIPRISKAVEAVLRGAGVARE